MNMNIYAIYDQAVDAYGTPFFMPNDSSALRAFTGNINNKDIGNMLYNHPEQFTLYKIGQYEDSVGLIKSYSEPQRVVNGQSVSEKKSIDEESLSIRLDQFEEQLSFVFKESQSNSSNNKFISSALVSLQNDINSLAVELKQTEVKENEK
jgi:hypothetical protein